MSVTGSQHKDVFFEGHGTLCRVAGCSIYWCRAIFLTLKFDATSIIGCNDWPQEAAHLSRDASSCLGLADDSRFCRRQGCTAKAASSSPCD